ncbi:MAG: metal ABC transporter substrate-binding protein [Puniceicoccales bacterium]|jgi:ABC-type Zn uptake system ZnuABC Zn-binding protein ZnuA|nr:metal ABC transporter substrate-binding protein [Puniceicoccales bacterium]
MKISHALRTLFASLVCIGAVAAAARADVNIVATTSDLGALAKAVGGNNATVTTLARATEDPHFVDARPSFLRILNKADLLIEGGADLEAGWLPPLVNNARNAKILSGAQGRFSAAASAGLVLRDVPHSLDRSQGDVHASGNPHFLLSPSNAAHVALALAERLAQLDAANAAAYRARAAQFRAEAEKRLADWRRRLAPLRGKAVVTYHHSFNYFLDAFELKLADTIEPKPGIEPAAAHIVALVGRMKSDGVKLIFAEPNRPTRTCERVATGSGAKLLRLPLMPGGVAGTDDYFTFIEHNVAAVEATLK